jgi:hypothetical protein
MGGAEELGEEERRDMAVIVRERAEKERYF